MAQSVVPERNARIGVLPAREKYISAAQVYLGALIALPCLTAVLTGLRLYARGIRRWGWDDSLICVGCVWMVVLAPMALEILYHVESGYSTIDPLFWTSDVALLGCLWSARLSILLSVTRITPSPQDRKRREKICIAFTGLFVLEVIVFCVSCLSHHSNFPLPGLPTCFFTKQIPVVHLISGTLADSVLLVLPLLTLRGLKRNAPHVRRRLSLAFMTSACTTICSLVGAMDGLLSGRIAHGFLAPVEVYVALIVCNLPVLVIAVTRLYTQRNPRQEDKLPTIKFASRSGYAGSSEATQQQPETNSTDINWNVQSSHTMGLKSFWIGVDADEEECEAEVRRICQKREYDQALERFSVRVEVPGAGRSKESLRSSRRHSMDV